jgi:spermidine/putrescine transport system permease protein
VKLLLTIYAAAAYLFLYLPLIVLSVFSFNSSRVAVWQGWTLRWYSEAIHNAQMLEAAWNSIVIGLCAAVLATVIGTLAGYALWKKRLSWLTQSLYLSLLTPEIVTGVSLLAFYQWVFRYAHVQLGMHTVILARLRMFDPALEEAALDLGATEWQAFQRVTLPFLAPAILAAGLLCFAVSFDDYVITSMVAGVDSETLPMVIYALARRGVSPTVNAMSAIITVGLGTLVLVAGRLQRQKLK